MRHISDSTVRARKHHLCDACFLFNRSGYGERDVSPDEWLIVQAAQSDHWKILTGQQYRRAVYDDGGLRTYKARLDMDALCEKLELFEE